MNESPTLNDVAIVSSCIIIALIIFAVDMLTAAGVLVSLLYVPVGIIAFYLRGEHATRNYAIVIVVIIVFIVTGYVISPGGGIPSSVALTNRALNIFVVLGIALLMVYKVAGENVYEIARNNETAIFQEIRALATVAAVVNPTGVMLSSATGGVIVAFLAAFQVLPSLPSPQVVPNQWSWELFDFFSPPPPLVVGVGLIIGSSFFLRLGISVFSRNHHAFVGIADSLRWLVVATVIYGLFSIIVSGFGGILRVYSEPAALGLVAFGFLSIGIWEMLQLGQFAWGEQFDKKLSQVRRTFRITRLILSNRLDEIELVDKKRVESDDTEATG